MENTNCGGSMFCPRCGNRADIVNYETSTLADGRVHYYTVVCPVCRSQTTVEWRTSKRNSAETVNSLLMDIYNCNDSNCDACTYSKENNCMNHLLTALSIQLQDYKYLLEHKQNVDS